MRLSRGFSLPAITATIYPRGVFLREFPRACVGSAAHGWRIGARAFSGHGDSGWHSVIDSDRPHVGKALREWLSPENFDADGVQKRSLSAVRASGA
ncbi:acetyltransferase, GNAT family [Streptomyces laurentii]|uniref:Acetyltransferase, GNAT family n=1 Tax=Streptomyces laurentii TaxID=39478 RepID=A0A170RZJ0_STRLU|nr:acetyltransferase, GNAT family [Streptomyces laurentii]